MQDSIFSFSSEPENQFIIPDEGLEVTINRSEGRLEIFPPDSESVTFPLFQGESPQEQAIFITGNNPKIFEVGEVDFFDHFQQAEDIPINTSQDDLVLKIRQESRIIGILDVRDVSKRSILTFKFSIIPLKLSIAGNYLRITSLEYNPDFQLEPWIMKCFY